MVDLWVLFDNNLTFSDHISEKINKAYSVLGIIKISQWYARMLNLQIRFGARIR